MGNSTIKYMKLESLTHTYPIIVNNVEFHPSIVNFGKFYHQVHEIRVSYTYLPYYSEQC